MIFHCIKPIFLLTVVLLSFFNLKAQNKYVGDPFIQNFETAEVGGTHQNWSITQDNDGLIYVANQWQFFQYDGVKWNKIEKRKNASLRYINTDESGRIYGGGFNNLGYLDRKENGELFYNEITPLLPDSLKDFEDITGIIFMNNIPYFITYKYVIGWHGGDSFEVITHPKEVHKAFFVNNELFVRPMNSNVLKWKDGQLKDVPEFKDEIPKNLVGLFESKGGYFGYDHKKTLFEVDDKGTRIIGSPQTNELLRDAKVYDMVRLKDGNFALSTLLNGLFLLNRNGEILQHISQRNGLLSNAVKHVFEDRDGNLWLSLESGVARVEWQSKVRYLNENHNYPNALSMHSLNDRLFLGKEDGVYEFIIDDDNLFGHFKKIVDTRDMVLEIKHIENTLLIACDKFLWAMDLKTNKAELIQEGDVFNVAVFTDEKTKKKMVFTGFYTIKIFDFSRGKFTLLNQVNVPNQRVTGITPVSKDWVILTVYGPQIHFLDMREGIENAGIVVEPERDGRPDIFVYKLNWAFGELYGVSTSNEIYFVNKKWRPGDDSYVVSKEKIFSNSTIGADIPTGFIVQVSDSQFFNNPANQNYLVTFDKDALNRPNPNPKKIERVPFIDPGQLIGVAQYGKNGIIRVEDKRAVFFDVQSVNVAPQEAYPPLIRRINLIETDFIVYHGERLIDRKVVIPADKNSIRVEFSSPQYFASSKLEYRYKLEGFDRDFSTWSTENKKDYTNLPAGTFRFIVQVKNEEAVESIPREFEFSVLAPWYLSNVAYSVYALMVIGVVFQIVQWQTRKVLAKETEKARVKDIEYRAESAELQAKVAEAQAKAIEEEHNRKTAELEQARQIQTQLLPKIPPNAPTWNIEVRYKTATEVGGDYYDFVETKSGDLFIFVGDATGHGLAASIMVTMVKSALTFLDPAEPHKLLASLNVGLKKIRLSRLSMALTTVRYKDGIVTFASAAMPPLYKLSKNGVEEIMQSGPPLGAISFANYESSTFSLEVGEKLIILSDGLPECIDPEGNMFGYKRVTDIIEKAWGTSVEAISDELMNEAIQFMNGAPLDDDITLVGFERLG